MIFLFKIFVLSFEYKRKKNLYVFSILIFSLFLFKPLNVDKIIEFIRDIVKFNFVNHKSRVFHGHQIN